jgi:streptogramin lyase
MNVHRTSSHIASRPSRDGALAGSVFHLTLCLAFGLALGAGNAASAMEISGIVRGPSGAGIEGAMVTFETGSPKHSVTVFSGATGYYQTPTLRESGPYQIRVRRITWKDFVSSNVNIDGPQQSRRMDFTLEPETDPAKVAIQLPSNRWFALVLDSIEQPHQREELVRQCTYCHQQGNWATRVQRTDEQWQKVLNLMGRMGASLSPELRAQVPTLFNRAYALDTAIPKLTHDMNSKGFAPPPAPEVQSAAIEEWVLGHPASMQHDLIVHPDGRVYSVDMTQDKLYRLDPSTPSGERAVFDVPRGDLPLGGIFGKLGGPAPSTANAHVGPHSLQVAPDGAIWMTLALGNQLARFDPKTEDWSIHPLEEGFYPHTLRFDQKGRVWYTVAASNHVGVYDPAKGTHQWIRLPAPTWRQAIAMRLIPAFMWLAERVDLSGGGGGGGIVAPVPYGIDVAPNGDIWFSQLNAHRIGRIDPESFDVEMIDTPFTAPRRMRFDASGKLWIPGFSSGLISRFDPETREFKQWPLPIKPIGSETPYALNVDLETNHVWICGTNSDSLIRFDSEAEHFTVFPLPTRVTYTREIDFDSKGRVWASNSNMPAWQIEGAQPRILRLDPNAIEVGEKSPPTLAMGLGRNLGVEIGVGLAP